jgi:prevent-host-death family protein
VTTLNQRELRNDSADVLRRVEQGETFTITRRGVPVAVLGPLPPSDLRCDRPAAQRPQFVSRPRVRAEATSGEVLDDMRGHR